MATSIGRMCVNSSTVFLRCLTARHMKPMMCRVHPVAGYAKKAGKGAALGPDKERMEVETDPEKLLKYCCGANYHKEGPQVELKADSEYPDWLWDLHIGPPKKLEELDPESPQYWRRLKKMDIKRQNKLSKYNKF